MDLLKKLFSGTTPDPVEEKVPTSAHHWTEAHMKPVPARQARRARQRAGETHSRKFYDRKKREVRNRAIEAERDALWLLRKAETKMGRRWFEDEDDRETVMSLVGDNPTTRANAFLNAKAQDIMEKTGLDDDSRGRKIANAAALKLFFGDAQRIAKFDLRKTFSATPEQVVAALGVTMADALPYEIEDDETEGRKTAGYTDETGVVR